MRIDSVVCAGITVVLLASCARERPEIEVEYRRGYAFTAAERRAIERVANAAARDARDLLPGLSQHLRLTVQPGANVIPETGETAGVGLPGGVYWTVDPARDGGVLRIANEQLRATLFHEFYHLVRGASVPTRSLIDQAIDEGLATAFERDETGAPTPWGDYPDDVASWAEEFLALPADAPSREWMFLHPDGRRWIGYKVGTYFADQARRASGHSLAELATVPTEELLAWARRR